MGDNIRKKVPFRKQTNYLCFGLDNCSLFWYYSTRLWHLNTKIIRLVGGDSSKIADER
jgi:hypothetical protein